MDLHIQTKILANGGYTNVGGNLNKQHTDMGQIKIQESTIDLTDGRKGQVAVLMYAGPGDPVAKLDWAVSEYVGNVGHNQFIDINNDNPWIRVIIYGINDMDQEDFDPTKHKLKP